MTRTLSPRETDVIRLAITGQRSKQIAETLGISQRTVEVHRCHILTKLGAGNIAQAAVIYDRGRRCGDIEV